MTGWRHKVGYQENTWPCVGRFLSLFSLLAKYPTTSLWLLVAFTISWGSANGQAISLYHWLDSRSGSLSVTPTIPGDPWAIGGFVTHITIFKTWACKASAWVRVLSSTLATGFPWFPLDGLLSLILFYLRLRPSKVSASSGVGFSMANFPLCSAFFFVFNLGLIYDAGCLHRSLIHFLKVGIYIPFYYQLYLSF